MRKTTFLGLLLVVALAAVGRADMQVQTYEPNRQDRFYTGADKDFLGQPFDWSGVGQTSGGTWATMISPSYFVSAAHYHPGAGDVLKFYQTNDPAGPSYQFTVSSWSYQGNLDGTPSDLWLGKLDTPIPANDHIKYYPVPVLPNNSDYVGQMIYVNGKPNRVGRNIIDRITTAQEPDPPAVPYKNTVAMEYDFNTTNGLGADECYLHGGDSGGPSFMDVNGQLAVVGTHYYNGGTPGPVDLGLISGDSFVPYYVNQLKANMTGETVTTTAPVPGLIAWIGNNKLGPTDWAAAANWDPNTTVPSGPGVKVGFGNQLAAKNVVDMISQGQTVGSITFFAGTSTTIQSSGGFSLTFDNNGAASTIDVAGSHTISAPVVLDNDAVISGAGTLNLSGGITGNFALTVLGNLTASSIQVDTLNIGGTLTSQAVPEPSAFIILGMGVLGFLAFARRCNAA